MYILPFGYVILYTTFNTSSLPLDEELVGPLANLTGPRLAGAGGRGGGAGHKKLKLPLLSKTHPRYCNEHSTKLDSCQLPFWKLVRTGAVCNIWDAADPLIYLRCRGRDQDGDHLELTDLGRSLVSLTPWP